jgi:hypothetical protein
MPASRQTRHRCRRISLLVLQFVLLVLQFVLLVVLLGLEVYEWIFDLEYISEKLDVKRNK